MTKVKADTIRELYRKGKSVKEIAQLLKVEGETIRYHIIKDHIRETDHCSYPLKEITDDFVAQVNELLAQGYTKVYIANALKRNIHDIFRAVYGDEYIERFKRDKE